jgi:DNA-binding beta-propeller fold protein YncE
LISRRIFLALPAAALIGCGRKKGSGFDGYAFVANAEGNAIAVVDLMAFAVARHIRLGASPTAVIASPVVPVVYALTPDTGTVHEIATETLSVRRKVQVAMTAASMRLSPDHQSLWVACREPRKLVRVGLEQLHAHEVIPLPYDIVDWDLSPAGDLAAASFGPAGVAGVIELTRRSIRVLNLGRELSRIVFRSDAKQLIVGNVTDRLVSILEWPGGRLVAHLPLAVRPDNFCVGGDGGQLFVTGEGRDAVAIIFTYTAEVDQTVLAGRNPGPMATVDSADGSFLFVANPDSGEVTILEIDTRRVIAVAAVGQAPGFIKITPDRQYALVLNQKSGDMAVIRIAAVAASRAKAAPLFTMIPVGSRPVDVDVRGA